MDMGYIPLLSKAAESALDRLVEMDRCLLTDREFTPHGDIPLGALTELSLEGFVDPYYFVTPKGMEYWGWRNQ